MATTVRVRFAELDPYGHVNHAVYLTYFEQSRIDVLESHGIGLAALQRRGLQLVVVETHVRFHAPAVAEDVVRVESVLDEVRPASTRWRQRIVRGDTLLATADVRTAITGMDGRPCGMPADVAAALADVASDAV